MLENKSDGSAIQNYFELLQSLTLSEHSKDFIKSIKDRLQPVEMSDYVTCLADIGIQPNKLRQFGLKLKHCYNNAANVCIYGNSPFVCNQSHMKILYCEGYVNSDGIVFEHAWNCIKNTFTGEIRYFDVTYQYVLSYQLYKIHEYQYSLVRTYSLEELNSLRLKYLCSGPYLQNVL